MEDEEDKQRQLESVPNNLKLSNKNSVFAKKIEERQSAKDWFNKHAEMDFSSMESRKEASTILVSAFWNMMNSKELEENKGPIRLKAEKSIIDDLIQFAIQSNIDEQEMEGAGSIYVLALCLKALIKQQNRINQLEYQIQQLKK